MQPDSRLSNLPFHREAQGVLFIAALLLPSSDALFHCSGQERQGPGAREICTSSYCPRFRFTPAAFPCRAEPVEAVGQGGTWLCPSKTSQALKEQRKCAGEPSSAQSGTASLSTPGSSQLFNTVKHNIWFNIWHPSVRIRSRVIPSESANRTFKIYEPLLPEKLFIVAD